jgi:hypothetical protein
MTILIESTYCGRFQRTIQGDAPQDGPYLGIQRIKVGSRWVETDAQTLPTWLEALDWVGSIGVLNIDGRADFVASAPASTTS